MDLLLVKIDPSWELRAWKCKRRAKAKKKEGRDNVGQILIGFNHRNSEYNIEVNAEDHRSKAANY